MKFRVVVAGFLLCALMARAEEDAGHAPSLVACVTELATVLERYGLAPDAARACEEAMRAIVIQADPGGGLYTAEDAERLEAAARGRVFHAGIKVSATNGQMVVVEIAAESGAEQAGIQPGETIETLDRGSVSGMKASDLAELLRSTANVPVLLGVKGTNGEVRDVEVPLTVGSAPAVDLAEDLPTGIAYVRLNGLFEKSDREIISTLRRWVGTSTYGLVLDLRGADGADVDAAAAVASLFSQEGALLFSLRDTQDQDIAVYKARPAFRMDMPTMVLVDGRTSGAAEALAAALAGSARGVMLIGDVTQGDPLIREFLDFSGDLKIHLATRKLVVADGITYTGREGVKPHLAATPEVTPDYEPEMPEEEASKITDEEREDRRLRDRVRGDSVLRRAVDLLQGLRALNIGTTRTPETAPR